MQNNWLIAVDLDGTLFHTDHQISARTLSAMHMVVERGHSLVVITGRSLHSSVPRLLSIPSDTRIICSNGAYQYNRENQKIEWSNSLSASSAVLVRQRIIDQLPTASFGWESENGLSYEQKFMEEAGGAHTLEQGGLNQIPEHADVLKLFVRTPEKRGGDLAEFLQEILGGDVEVSSSGVPFVEITAAGTNKGSALARIASDLGFSAERTMAFGDNLNDMSMLLWAGESVAMGNAVPELQAIASARALSNAEDGVAHYLESRFMGS